MYYFAYLLIGLGMGAVFYWFVLDDFDRKDIWIYEPRWYIFGAIALMILFWPIFVVAFIGTVIYDYIQWRKFESHKDSFDDEFPD